jgi:hypothetical protein
MEDTRRQLARDLDCLLEEDVSTLTDTEVGTVRNWRSRRFGPPFVALGNVILYPRADFRDWIAKNLEVTLPAATAIQTSGTRRRRTEATTT